MKVFISWSGETSKKVALALKAWLPNVKKGVRSGHWTNATKEANGTKTNLP